MTPATLSLVPLVAEFVRILPDADSAASGADADNSQCEPPRNSHEFRYEIRFLLRRAGPSWSGCRQFAVNHANLTNSATRLRFCYGERKAPATLSLVPLVAEFVRILPSRGRRRKRSDADNSQANHRGILTNSATRLDSCYGEQGASGPATLPLVPLVAEFVRILPRRAQESGADADNSQSNHRGILTNSATRLDSCYGEQGHQRQPPYHSFPS